MESLLEIKNLKVKFYLEKQEITAVDGVNLNVKRGETVVLAGESGSGKTVTALAITKILPPQAKIVSGAIQFEKENILDYNERALTKIRGKEIAYIFQEPVSYLNPVYSVGNQIIEAIVLHQDKKKKAAMKEAEELLSLVKIKDIRRVLFSYPHQLSGGMNQRVFIAMSLACKPKLLIADEPTTSLDVTIEAEILHLLQELKRTLGFSLLFITHNLSIAKRIADRVCVMYQGKIVEEADRVSIFNSPAHFHTKELVSAYELIGRV